ncbi:hypothetical protein WYI_20975 [Ochrobactrum sp. CDB2]|nr:hypothetical protein WYI_20975 [Ochrobactrum sp. CDB2]
MAVAACRVLQHEPTRTVSPAGLKADLRPAPLSKAGDQGRAEPRAQGLHLSEGNAMIEGLAMFFPSQI